MARAQKNYGNVLSVIFAITAFIIFLDFVLPGQMHNEQVSAIRKTLQRSYNAAKNHHFSYGLQTERFYFPVSEKFAENIAEGQSVLFKVSPIFKKVNSYESLESGESGVYSLRLVSGLIVPLLAMIILGMTITFRKYAVPALIIKTLIFLDLIYLLY